MNYSTVKYRIIVCKKKISQTFPNYRFKNNYFDAFYRWKRTHAKILRFKRTKDRREGRRRNKKTCILGKHMKHIEGGKTLGTNFFRHFQVPRSRFPFGNHFNLHALVSRYPKIHKGMGASSISISPVPMIPPSSCYTRCSTNTFNIVSYSWMEKDYKKF